MPPLETATPPIACAVRMSIDRLLGAGTALLLIAMVTLLVAACGDGGDNGASDQERAERMLLTLADLPDGWFIDAFREEVAPPLGLASALSDLRVTGTAESPFFVRGLTPTARHIALILESEGDAAVAFQRIAGQDVGRVAAEIFKTRVETLGEQDFRAGATVTIGPSGTRPFLRLGDESALFRGMVTLEVEGTMTPVFLDVALIRRGRAVSLIHFSGFLVPPPAAVVEMIAELLTQRMEP